MAWFVRNTITERIPSIARFVVDIGDLVQQFREAAIAKASWGGAKRDHRLHRLMSKAFSQLRDKGDEGCLAFRRLLKDESPEVVCWVAAQLICESNLPAARTALRKLAAGDGSLAFDAEVTLEEYKKGRLRSPFGKLGR
jgi:hypothetical protein